MSLWADKYRPKSLSELDYHKEQAQDLKNLTQDADFPHLLVYGPLGAGKKTRIMCLLKELYGEGAEHLRVETTKFTTLSNKKLEIKTVSSNYHIEINPSDVGIYDRIVIMDIIKNVAQTQQLNIKGGRNFKVIVMTDVHNLTKDAQEALRRTMEKYIATCRLILCTTSLSHIIPAIRSRCLCIRVPAPTLEEIVTVLQDTCKKEEVQLPVGLAKHIAKKSQRNLRRALLMCETCKVENKIHNQKYDIPEPDWQLFIKETAKNILQGQSPAILAEVRENLYELITNGIPSEIIFKSLLQELLWKCDDFDLQAKVIEQAAIYQHRMSQENKEITHLEAFVAKFMYLYHCNLKGIKFDDDF